MGSLRVWGGGLVLIDFILPSSREKQLRMKGTVSKESKCRFRVELKGPFLLTFQQPRVLELKKRAAEGRATNTPRKPPARTVPALAASSLPEGHAFPKGSVDGCVPSKQA